MNSSNRISAVMPVKNGAAYISNLIGTLNSNLREDDELVVIDDHSDDDSFRELVRWSEMNEKVRVLKNGGNGLVDALNFGISEAQNTWIARFDVDDLYSKNRLNAQRYFLKPNVVAVFSDYSFFSDSEFNLGSIQSGVTSNATKLSLVSGQRTAHSSAIFNKVAFNHAGGYRKKDFPAEDLSLWLRLSRLGDFYSVPDILMNYRIGSNSITSTKRSESLSKKRSLIHEIGLEDAVVANSLREWQAIFNDYREYESMSRRKILFLRDVVQICREKKLSRLDMKYALELTSRFLINPQNLFVARDLYVERRLRNQIRAKFG
ncbi:WcaA Glycosyltransferases involved in cell wall biogenesis [actinobacterium SCGC AAA044-D11]